MPTALTTTEIVKSFAEVVGTNDDALITLMISGLTQYVSNRTGITDFGAQLSFDEVYDGNGNDRLFLRNVPISSVALLEINGIAIPASSGFGFAGYFVDTDARSIALRGGAGAIVPTFGTYTRALGYGYCFTRGMAGNIHVKYTAGYATVPADLALMAVRVVAQTYQRRKNIDQRSKTFSTGGGGSGTTSYRDWAFSPEDELTLNYYKRRAIIG